MEDPVRLSSEHVTVAIAQAAGPAVVPWCLFAEIRVVRPTSIGLVRAWRPEKRPCSP